MGIGIVGFKCPRCGHKITSEFNTSDERTMQTAWMLAKARFERHMYGPTQEERDFERCEEDCNG